MECPYCGSQDLSVIDKRNANEDTIRRRRACSSCGKRFTTYEKIELIEIYVVKKDGTRAPFDRSKLLAGIVKACEKRPIGVEKIQGIADRIEHKVRKSGVKEIDSKKIGEMAMQELYKLDPVAYIRFASVYNRFSSPEEFRKVAIMLNKKAKNYAK